MARSKSAGRFDDGPVKATTPIESQYRIQPNRIENYVPGASSISRYEEEVRKKSYLKSFESQQIAHHILRLSSVGPRSLTFATIVNFRAQHISVVVGVIMRLCNRLRRSFRVICAPSIGQLYRFSCRRRRRAACRPCARAFCLFTARRDCIHLPAPACKVYSAHYRFRMYVVDSC